MPFYIVVITIVVFFRTLCRDQKNVYMHDVLKLEVNVMREIIK